MRRQTRNPKHEARNKSQSLNDRNLKDRRAGHLAQSQLTLRGHRVFGALRFGAFEFVSSFGIRYSDFRVATRFLAPR
jgi:hypothetical protein